MPPIPPTRLGLSYLAKKKKKKNLYEPEKVTSQKNHSNYMTMWPMCMMNIISMDTRNTTFEEKYFVPTTECTLKTITKYIHAGEVKFSYFLDK